MNVEDEQKEGDNTIERVKKRFRTRSPNPPDTTVSCCFADLPREILELIVKQLDLKSYNNFYIACLYSTSSTFINPCEAHIETQRIVGRTLCGACTRVPVIYGSFQMRKALLIKFYREVLDVENRHADDPIFDLESDESLDTLCLASHLVILARDIVMTRAKRKSETPVFTSCWNNVCRRPRIEIQYHDIFNTTWNIVIPTLMEHASDHELEELFINDLPTAMVEFSAESPHHCSEVSGSFGLLCEYACSMGRTNFLTLLVKHFKSIRNHLKPLLWHRIKYEIIRAFDFVLEKHKGKEGEKVESWYNVLLPFSKVSELLHEDDVPKIGLHLLKTLVISDLPRALETFMYELNFGIFPKIFELGIDVGYCFRNGSAELWKILIRSKMVCCWLMICVHERCLDILNHGLQSERIKLKEQWTMKDAVELKTTITYDTSFYFCDLCTKAHRDIREFATRTGDRLSDFQLKDMKKIVIGKTTICYYPEYHHLFAKQHGLILDYARMETERVSPSNT